MSEFGARVVIDAPAESVFEFVCNPMNMPEFLPTVSAAEVGVNRGRYIPDGWFDVDQAHLSMRWGSDGENLYMGHLDVRPLANRLCEAEVHLSFESPPDQEIAFVQQMDTRQRINQQGLERAMNSIKLICERRTADVPAAKEPGKAYMG